MSVNDRLIIDLKAKCSALTPRQREVCALMVRGMTAKQVAIELAISPRTVEDHRLAVFRHFDAHNAAEVLFRLCGDPHVVA